MPQLNLDLDLSDWHFVVAGIFGLVRRLLALCSAFARRRLVLFGMLRCRLLMILWV